MLNWIKSNCGALAGIAVIGWGAIIVICLGLAALLGSIGLLVRVIQWLC